MGEFCRRQALHKILAHLHDFLCPRVLQPGVGEICQKAGTLPKFQHICTTSCYPRFSSQGWPPPGGGGAARRERTLTYYYYLTTALDRPAPNGTLILSLIMPHTSRSACSVHVDGLSDIRIYILENAILPG
jgi:hypothetical protein